ncbi:glycerophosphodiester phosphodiesterase [Carnobacterium mobile]|uniref:glycerophosphodiester phosphodiesterase n=1 Tax=Carnobacterium mobile TaxID=2750 RepID=UPI001D02BD1F|nr:glycerophosphodiester phosphodiesterase [Carnobacterium mobile]
MNKTEVFAHRGSKGTHPENTLVAFEEAIRVGSDGIELDVHLSRDNEVVVIHDETVDRTSNGKGLVRELTLQELKQLDAGSWFSEDYTDCRIPALQEVIDFLIDSQFKGTLNIELKTDHYAYPGIEEKVIKLTDKKEIQFKIVFSSFNYQTLIRLKELNPTVEIALLFEKNGRDLLMLDTDIMVTMWHPSLLWFREKMLTDEVKMAVRLWTINQTQELAYCFNQGIAGVITDYPEKALALRNQLETTT